MTEEYEVGCYHCKDCEHFSFVLPSGGGCKKRIDHKHIEFAVPWFRCSPEEAGMPCSDFKPSSIHVVALKHWRGWENYWAQYVKLWLPYQNENILVYFTLNGNTDVRYGVPLKKYLYGEMIIDNRLLAVEKVYYKKRRPTSENSFPYCLVREKIDGVDITTGGEDNASD